MSSILSLSDYLKTVLPDAVLISVFRPKKESPTFLYAKYGFVFLKPTSGDHYVVEVGASFAPVSNKWRAKDERGLREIKVRLAVLGAWDRKISRFTESPAIAEPFTITPESVAVKFFMDSVREMYFDFRDATQSARGAYE